MLCLVTLAVFSIHQYKLQTLYKNYLSQNLSFDIIILAQAIQTNNSIYEQILRPNTEDINVQKKLNELYHNYWSIASILDTYSSMYDQFHDFSEYDSLNIENITSSSIQMKFLLQEVVSNNTPFDSKIKTILEKNAALNAVWLKTIKDSDVFIIKENDEIRYSKEKNLSIHDINWVNFFKNLEKRTSDFLKEHN